MSDMNANGSSNGSPNGASAPAVNVPVDERGDARVLVVEDESLVAFDLADMLEDMGFADVTVTGSYDDAEDALQKVSDGDAPFRLAIFDLNLDGRLSVPLIERAAAMGTGVIVASGYESRTVPSGELETPRMVKPYDARTLGRLIDGPC